VAWGVEGEVDAVQLQDVLHSWAEWVTQILLHGITKSEGMRVLKEQIQLKHQRRIAEEIQENVSTLRE
jgi:hypothetical protein